MGRPFESRAPAVTLRPASNVMVLSNGIDLTTAAENIAMTRGAGAGVGGSRGAGAAESVQLGLADAAVPRMRFTC